MKSLAAGRGCRTVAQLLRVLLELEHGRQKFNRATEREALNEVKP
jgi:hypothetical protein